MSNTRRYDRHIIDLNRAAQRDNPELAVCTKRSQLKEQVAQLRYITRELNIVTGAHTCSDNDDEDCVDTVPHICNYYTFPDSYKLDPDKLIESSSGSGSGDGMDVDEDDACATVDSRDPTTTTTTVVIVSQEKFEGTDATDDDSLPTDSGAIKCSSMTLLTLVLVVVSLLWNSCRNCL